MTTYPGLNDVLVVSSFVGSIVDPELEADAILNASNPHVALGSGVSGAIADACGGVDYQREVHAAWEDQFDEPLEPTDCLVTGAGKANAFRHVLHVPAVDYTKRDPETGGSSGPTRVRQCTRAALDEAHAHDVRVLGVPLLGAGHGGLGAVASADAMLAAIRRFAEENANASLIVRFAVLETSHASLIENAAAKHQVPFSGAS